MAVFSLLLYVLRRWTASAASYQFVLLPFVAVTVAALLLGEKVTPLFGLGGVLVLAGVWVGALAKPREKGACVERGAAAGALAPAAQLATEGACN